MNSRVRYVAVAVVLMVVVALFALCMTSIAAQAQTINTPVVSSRVVVDPPQAYLYIVSLGSGTPILTSKLIGNVSPCSDKDELTGYECIRWYDTDGVYHKQYLSLALALHLSDHPVVWNSEILDLTPMVKRAHTTLRR